MLVTILVGQCILETCVALPLATGLLERLIFHRNPMLREQES